MADISGESLRGLSEAIQSVSGAKRTATLTKGTVIESGATKWVQLENGQRFPAENSTADVSNGDAVTVTIDKGVATITGNSSTPATSSNYVDSTVAPVREAAEKAAKAASDATISAGQAKEQAASATESATEAKTQAAAAKAQAETAEAEAGAAKTAADEAKDQASAATAFATEAKTAATEAKNQADQAMTSAATAQSAAETAQSSANTAITNAATAQSKADEAATAAATAKAQADQATTDAATAGIAASRAQTAAQAAERAIGIEPDETKTEDELVSQSWFWTDGGGAHVVAGRKDGTPTSTTQTDINDKGLSVVSLEDYSTLASFGVDNDGNPVSRLGDQTKSYTEVTESGLDTYVLSGEVSSSVIDVSKINEKATLYHYSNSLVKGISILSTSKIAFDFSLNLENSYGEAGLPSSFATAIKLSDLFPLAGKNLIDISLNFKNLIFLMYGYWSIGIVSKIEQTTIGQHTFYTLVNRDNGVINNLLNGDSKITSDKYSLQRGINGVDSINDCYLVFAFRQTKLGDGVVSSSFVIDGTDHSAVYYFGELTKHHAASIGVDDNGLIRAKIGDEGYVQIDDMQMDIYRAEADVTTSKLTTFALSSGSQAVVETGWTFSVSSTSKLSFTVPSGAETCYSVFKLTDVWDIVNTSTRRLDISLDATAWSSDSSISYLEFYILDKPYLYDSSGEMVDYLYYSGNELPLAVSFDEMQWAKLSNLYIAFALGTDPETLPATLAVTMGTVTAYLYTPTGDATIQSHFGRKTELSYTESTDYKTPMFSLDPDAGFKVVSPDANGWDVPGASISGDAEGLYLSSFNSLTTYAPTTTLTSNYGVNMESITLNAKGGVQIDREADTGDTGLWIARNGGRNLGFIQSQSGNRGFWDVPVENWMIYRPAGEKNTYINGLSASFAYSSHSIYSSKSIAGGSYVNGTTNVSRSGYKPFAIAGWSTSTRWHNCNRAYLSSIWDGGGTITWMVNNWNSSAKSGDLTLWILWIRY